MELRRITPEYFADAEGVRELLRSPGVQKAVAAAGDDMKSLANRIGRSTYESETTRVRAGWNNESRPGVRVYEVDHDVRDSLNRTLARVAASMNRRWRR